MALLAIGNVAVLVIAAIYYVWCERVRAHPIPVPVARPRRVALLLWAAAQSGK